MVPAVARPRARSRLMVKTLIMILLGWSLCSFAPTWGFFAHERINKLAVFTLPEDMIGFYKDNLATLQSYAVMPDKRRYAVEDEAPRHYLDLDHYPPDSLPRDWAKAIATFGKDSLTRHGILPWHIALMQQRLTEAFRVGDPDAIIKLSAELGHYVSDAHVPLHTTKNYNGQLSGQEGIHGLWESRLPELFFPEYDLFTGPATYVEQPATLAWTVLENANSLVQEVLETEKELSRAYGEKRYSFETRGAATVKVYASEYAAAYHEGLRGMVRTQIRASIKHVGSLWYTAWVDAGQPDLKRLRHNKPTRAELNLNRRKLAEWKKLNRSIRSHE